MQNQERLTALAQQWQECAHQPMMDERRKIWTAVNDLRQIRPAVLVETCLMTDYVTQEELRCTGEYERNIEKFLIENIRHAQEIGDDFVLEPYLRVPWDFCASDFGVEIGVKHATDTYGDAVATTYVHPIQTPEQVDMLRPRTFGVERATTLRNAERLNELLGGVLPVTVGGIDQVYGAAGYSPWCGMHITELTLNLYMLIGMDNFYYWLYDEPALIHRLMQFLLDDFIRYNQFLENEGLLCYNANNALTGGRYGYCSDVQRGARMRDLWLWCHAEETTTLSPQMYAEFILPYLAQAAAQYGKIYFGCCENIESRWEQIRDSIKNLRAVSVSPFSNQRAMAEYLRKDYVFSRKPHAGYVAELDWEGARKDVRETFLAARDCNLEIILRDVYRLNGRREIFRDWVEMVKSYF